MISDRAQHLVSTVNDVNSLISSMNDLITTENKSILVKRILTLSSYGDSLNAGPLRSINEMYLNHLDNLDFFDQISAKDQAGPLMEETTVGVNSSGDNGKSLLRFTLRDQDAVGMITDLQSGMTLFLKPSGLCQAQMYSLSSQDFKTLSLVTARSAADDEAARIAVDVEAARIATDVEAARIAAVVEAARIARRDDFIAAEMDAARLSAAESASAHRPVEQSPECEQAERNMYKFVMRMIINHDIWYLQEKMADKSPPPQTLPARAVMLLGKVIRFYAAHYAPASQGEKSFADPHTGGPTCKTNEIIYDAIYASLPDDCKLTFAQMFCNFDDLCPFKAPLYVNGERFDFEKHVLYLLTDEERAQWWRLTVNHLKWKYIDAIKNGVRKAILFVFGRLPKKYWPDKHKEALQIAREYILDTEGRVVEFMLEIVTCDHISSLYFGRDDEIIDEMQEALKKSHGGILEGRVVNHLMPK